MRHAIAVGQSVFWMASASAAPYFWIDDSGVTHMTDRLDAVPSDVRAAPGTPDITVLRGLWSGDVVDLQPRSVDPWESRRAASQRSQRIVAGALEDIARGERARASAALESVLRDEPAHPQAHWILAGLDRERARYASAERHLAAFLASAGDDLEDLRERAQVWISELEEERRLSDAAVAAADLDFVRFKHPHFRVHYDAALGKASPDYANTVIGFLEDAHAHASARLGVAPAEPMGVVLYGKAAYLREHQHRFSFQTVGFFDGRIHVVSAAHPERELRDLLFHEYTHALFREQTGGDRPFWLNEGLAELSQRQGLASDGLTRSERVTLRNRIENQDWIPLRQLAPSFSGLEGEDARVGYLESTAAAAWIEMNTEPVQRRRLLEQLGDGVSVDQALRDAVGLDTEGLDRAVQRSIRARFPVTTVFP